MGPDAARDQGVHLRKKAWNLICPLLRHQACRTGGGPIVRSLSHHPLEVAFTEFVDCIRVVVGRQVASLQPREVQVPQGLQNQAKPIEGPRGWLSLRHAARSGRDEMVNGDTGTATHGRWPDGDYVAAHGERPDGATDENRRASRIRCPAVGAATGGQPDLEFRHRARLDAPPSRPAFAERVERRREQLHPGFMSCHGVYAGRWADPMGRGGGAQHSSMESVGGVPHASTWRS